MEKPLSKLTLYAIMLLCNGFWSSNYTCDTNCIGHPNMFIYAYKSTQSSYQATRGSYQATRGSCQATMQNIEFSKF